MTHQSEDRTRLTAMKHLAISAALMQVVFIQASCTGPKLVETPNLYSTPANDEFAAVPPALQTTHVNLLYATDRRRDAESKAVRYTSLRSRELAYGITTISMGKDMKWDELALASTTPRRRIAVPLRVSAIDELGRYSEQPPLIEVDGQWVSDPSFLEAQTKAGDDVRRLLSEQLALTPTKEVFLYVHGYNNTFDEAALRMSQIWHFMGRVGVPVIYSWPAGSSGLLRGYTHDRESGEFTNTHLKQFLRDVIACDELTKLNLIAHSRGTDVLATALKELHIEYRASGKNTREELKIGQLVLAAPDIDLDVFLERFGAENLGFVPEQLTVYVSPKDKAIGLSTWLFGSAKRLGQLALGDLGYDLAKAVDAHPVLHVVDVRVSMDFMGHGYFAENPAVLSDLILVLRDHRPPGAEYGRPLAKPHDGFWELRKGYPTRIATPSNSEKP